MITAEDILKQKEKEILSVTPDTTISNTIKYMVNNKIGAVMVKDGKHFIGIWSERDLLRLMTEENFNPRSAKVSESMTTELKSIEHNATVEEIFDTFLGLHIRHILVKKKKEIIGLLSTGDVVRAGLLEKDKQCRELNSLVSWEYYENWKWNPKKKPKK